MVPDLSPLLNIIDDMADYRRLRDGLSRTGDDTRVVVLDAAKPYLIAALHRSQQLPMLVVTARPENGKKLYEQLQIWTGPGPVRLFPEPDVLPYERIAADAVTELERVQALSTLAQYRNGTEDGVPLVVASAPALISRAPAYHDFAPVFHTIGHGTEIEPVELLRRWQAMGYRMESLVEIPGTMGRRGGIVDVYPPTGELPARLEFFGNTVESIRTFDPLTQRSVGEVASVTVGPATELPAPLMKAKPEMESIVNGLDLTGCTAEVVVQLRRELGMLLDRQQPPYQAFYAPLFNTDCILDYLPPQALLVLDEPVRIKQAVAELDCEAEQLRAEKLERGELPGNMPRPYFTWEAVEPKIGDKRPVRLTSFGADEESPRLDFVSAPGFIGQLPSFIKKTTQLLDEGKRLIVVSHQASRLSELLAEEGILAAPVNEIGQVPPVGSLTLVPGSLAAGWVLGGDTCLLTDAEIFGFVKQRRLVKRQPVPRLKLFVDITPGDYVVHVEHGIARFSEVTTMKTASGEQEYLVLHYAAGDKLYVPTSQIDRVNRYIGAGDRPPTLSRLGTLEWRRSKQRAKQAAEELARDLLALYAAREVVPGFSFSRDTLWQQELEASFPYVETPDQMEAQQEVKADMEKARPMDRLVCGDVGYGKTEVAIRATFKAVMDNRQVVVLVPTTVLAEQHYATFRERLDAFPIRVEVLSRFKSTSEQSAIIAGLASGTVDICIGTHRLLQKDVAFKDLGLLVIDEEQRFGVAHKEYLKRKRREVDVLTLSATPIPRTLHMSLVGVRDMSTMETPPEERLPIKTYVAEYNQHLVREAILRELERNGQVFFVHNRVQSIALVTSQLQELVPEANFAIAHGQMPEHKLAAVMADFTAGRTDVLVCTTIIESGLDMPNVNTLIVNRAEKFGLTQLYQLRGRVGRGADLAYAYFLYDGGKQLAPTAEKRLRTIYEATELGAGFTIALKDLEIRGAGTLLGTKQSGYINVVGFSLYCRLLAEAVEEQKAKLAGEKEAPRHLPPPTIDLPLNAYIPEDYVADVNTRLGLYQKLTGLDKAEQLDDIAREYSDRFGALPETVHNLLYVIRIKALATRAGVESITTEDGQVVIRLLPGMQFDKQKLAPVQDGVKIGVRQVRLNYRRMSKEWKRVLEEVVSRVGE